MADSLKNISEYKWIPNEKEQADFEKWRKMAFQMVMESKLGVDLNFFKSLLEYRFGCTMQLKEMGFTFPCIEVFLYEMMTSDLFALKKNGKIYIFPLEYAIPPAMSRKREILMKAKTYWPAYGLQCYEVGSSYLPCWGLLEGIYNIQELKMNYENAKNVQWESRIFK